MMAILCLLEFESDKLKFVAVLARNTSDGTTYSIVKKYIGVVSLYCSAVK